MGFIVVNIYNFLVLVDYAHSEASIACAELHSELGMDPDYEELSEGHYEHTFQRVFERSLASGVLYDPMFCSCNV